jgi:acetoin utilization deacetylase AcuC-like enzyme
MELIHGKSDKPTVPNAYPSATGYMFDERYISHVLEPFHPESPQRLSAIRKKLAETGLINDLSRIIPDEDPDLGISLVHSEKHVKGIDAIPKTGEIARLAVSGALSAVNAVATGKIRNAFCALRPPGHHALNTGQEEGFCFYNNIAIAAKYAQTRFNLKKVLVIDWDYHHGNGTEWAFFEDPSVLFFSTHDWNAYPGSGDPRRQGKGAGLGYTINVHCGFGTDDDDIYKIWDTRLLPAADEFKPDLVLISAGFDSRKDDPIGSFNLTDNCFFKMTTMAMKIAKTHCDGKLVSILEGGYNTAGLAEAVAAHLTALLAGT